MGKSQEAVSVWVRPSMRSWSVSTFFWIRPNGKWDLEALDPHGSVLGAYPSGLFFQFFFFSFLGKASMELAYHYLFFQGGFLDYPFFFDHFSTCANLVQ